MSRYFEAVTATNNGGTVVVVGHPAHLVCGGADDSHFESAKTTTEVTVTQATEVNVITHDAAGVTSRRLASSDFPTWLSTDHTGRIFKLDGPDTKLLGFKEIYHP